jgi:hypothetical protein
MRQRILNFLRNPYVLLLLLVAAIMAIDKILGRSGFDVAGNYELYTGALTPNAAFNDLLSEVWFAETIAVVALPFLLFFIRRKSKTKLRLAPWILAAAVMFFGIITRGWTIYQQYHTGAETGTTALLYEIHHGASYYPLYYDNIDPEIESVAPYFLRAQVPILLGFGAGYLGAVGYSRARKS